VRFLTAALFVLAITLCLVLAYRYLNVESTITLAVFNLFFVSLFYHLNGSLIRKAATLTFGDILGLTWNYVFQNVSYTGSALFGVSFNVFFSVIYPLLTLTWIVPFWSLSLSILPKPCRSVKPST
jgi:hypothetical protein